MTSVVDKSGGSDSTETKRYYDQLWRSRKRLHLEEKCRQRAILSFVRKISSDTAPPRIMDLGCGYGWLTKALSKFGDATGVDVSVDEARKRYLGIKFQEADIIHYEIMVATILLYLPSSGTYSSGKPADVCIKNL